MNDTSSIDVDLHDDDDGGGERLAADEWTEGNPVWMYVLLLFAANKDELGAALILDLSYDALAVERGSFVKH